MEKNSSHQKDGVALAALVAAGVGCAIIGLATILAEVSAAIKGLLTWSQAAGPLSGKTGIGVIAWLITWAFLHNTWKDQELNFSRNVKLAFTLVALGWLFTFPPFFELFKTH